MVMYSDIIQTETIFLFMELTQKQREVLSFIVEYESINGDTPQPVQISKQFGLTRQAVNAYLVTLEKKGWISRELDGGILIKRDLSYLEKWLASRLTSIKRMREEGILTEDEYINLRESIISGYKKRDKQIGT